MPYRYTGPNVLTYPQYRAGDGTVLVAHPGGIYDMEPVGPWPLPTPPGGGRWEPAGGEPPAGEPAAEDDAGEPEQHDPGLPPPPVIFPPEDPEA